MKSLFLLLFIIPILSRETFSSTVYVDETTVTRVSKGGLVEIRERQLPQNTDFDAFVYFINTRQDPMEPKDMDIVLSFLPACVQWLESIGKISPMQKYIKSKELYDALEKIKDNWCTNISVFFPYRIGQAENFLEDIIFPATSNKFRF